jgi:hypothetical protein
MPKKKSFLDYKLFEKIDNPIVAYFLGFLWADGWVNKRENINTFLIKINSEDADYLKEILPNIGKFNIRGYTVFDKRFNKNLNHTVFECSEKMVKKFLVENDYLVKSEQSPKKILSKIPKQLKKYFLRGLFDGDGNFYINKKQGLYHFYLHGSLNQNYDVLEDYLNEGGIQYKITRKNTKKGKCSYLRIVGKSHVIKLGEAIYDGYHTDLIGFNRKYNKFLEIKNT